MIVYWIYFARLLELMFALALFLLAWIIFFRLERGTGGIGGKRFLGMRQGYKAAGRSRMRKKFSGIGFTIDLSCFLVKR